jgi:hypothetical protein
MHDDEIRDGESESEGIRDGESESEGIREDQCINEDARKPIHSRLCDQVPEVKSKHAGGRPRKVDPWERVDGEGDRAYAAFQAYLRQSAGQAGRSIRRLVEDGHGSLKVVGTWSSKYKWKTRASAWDDYCAREAAIAAAKEHAQKAAIWERRKIADGERTYDHADRLGVIVDKMLSYPIRKRLVQSRYADGRPKEVIYQPAKWSLSTLGRLIELQAKMAAHAYDRSMAGDEWEDFDPSKATLEELRAFIASQGMRRAAAKAIEFFGDQSKGEIDKAIREAVKEIEE